MRSFTVKAALAAALVSTAFATSAYAEAQPTLNTPQPSLFDDMMRGRTSPMTTGSITPPAPAVRPAQQAMVGKESAYRPRLAQIVREIGTVNDRITVDKHHGYLNSVEADRVAARAREIHAEALRTADEHRGALPRADYQMLQQRISQLNQTIHHYATNA